MKTFIINKNDNDTAGDMVKHVFGVLASKDLVVTVKLKGEARKDSQRKLGNIWYTDAANFLGEDRDKTRNRFFYKFALPIFLREDIIVNGVSSAVTITCINDIKAAGCIEQYHHMIKSFVSLSTTNSFTVKQNSEYLKAIWDYCINERIYLSLPGDAEIAGFKP